MAQLITLAAFVLSPLSAVSASRVAQAGFGAMTENEHEVPEHRTQVVTTDERRALPRPPRVTPHEVVVPVPRRGLAPRPPVEAHAFIPPQRKTLLRLLH